MNGDFDPRRLRRHVLEMAFKGQSVHIPSAFSLVDILSALYGGILRIDPADPRSPGRDYLVLSKGHGAMALYACFRELGWIGDADIDGYFRNGSRLRGLVEANIPGVETSGGSLGHGLPIAVGLALGARLQGDARHVYCIVGDGEMNEGSNWESLLFAAHHKLDNLTVIVDANGFQAMGTTSEVLNLEPLGDKFRSFGFNAAECDGNAAAAVADALRAFGARGGQPRALIARTVKGAGVSFMENDNRWHYTRLTPETYAAALREVGGA